MNLSKKKSYKCISLQTPSNKQKYQNEAFAIFFKSSPRHLNYFLPTSAEMGDKNLHYPVQFFKKLKVDFRNRIYTN